MAAKKNIKQVLESYQPNGDESITRRATSLLLYCCREMPYKPVPVPWLTKIVFQEKKLPAEESRLVESMRDRSSSIREILRSESRKGLVSLPGQGWRATVDEDDFTRTQGNVGGMRAASALRNNQKNVDAIDSSKIKDADNKARYRQLSKADKLIGSGNIINLLEGDKKKDEEVHASKTES
jgi:hypothetical protein